MGCIDTLILNKFAPSYFNSNGTISTSSYYYMPQRDAADNIYISGNTNFVGGLNSYSSIIKFNAKNELVWYQNYKPFGPQPWTGFVGYGTLTGIDDTANLIMSDFNGSNTNPTTTNITKVDSAGNFKWSRQYSLNNPNLNIYSGVPIVASNGNLFCYGGISDNINHEKLITAIDPSGNIKWVKRYDQTGILKYHLLASNLVSQDANTLILYHSFYYNSDSYFDPAAKFAVQFVKINKADGSIRQQKSFMYFSGAAGINYIKCYSDKINYNPASHLFLLSSFSFDNTFQKRNQLLSLLDTNFNVVKSTFYLNSLQNNNDSRKSLSKENYSTHLQPESNPRRLLYVAFDNNLEIANQKIIDLSNLGFPNYNFTGDIGYKKNGILNFQLGTLASVATNSLYLFDHSPFYNGISPCLGKDTILFTKSPVYTFDVANETMYEVGTIPVSASDLIPNNTPVSFPLPKTELCKQISICDTIKLFGTKYHCLSNPIDSFKIYRNPLCVRKTNWQVDTNNIKILSQNDAALYVQYLQPYRGKIKVGFGGCSLTDSIAIEVYNTKTGINLGNDTMHCPGKTITLKAGKGFKTYKWQNNTTLDSLVAIQPGMYNVIATDSCGNIFKDTVTIASFDVVLKTDYPNRLCPADTVTFNLPTNLYNYSWLPATNSSLNNFTWRLFPSVTTTYSITGERLPGCTINDTVLINVKPNCLPDYIYFPTGFTPNGDTKNELYKPSINGQFSVYEFTIFNRYGQPIFKTNNPTAGWDGSFKNSKNPLSGTYVWQCRYQFVGRPVQQEQGSFVLIR